MNDGGTTSGAIDGTGVETRTVLGVAAIEVVLDLGINLME